MDIKKSNFNLWLITISLCALIPCVMAMKGVLIYFDFDNPTHREGLHIVGYANYYSSVLWIGYFVVLVGTWKRTTKKAIVSTSLPFVLLGSSLLLAISVGEI